MTKRTQSTEDQKLKPTQKMDALELEQGQPMVVFEDDLWLVLQKPSGMHSVPLVAGELNTAVSFALSHCPALEGVRGHLKDHPGALAEAGLVHRLDQATSGLLVFAKTQVEFERLRGLWKTDQVQKGYDARVVLMPGTELPKLPHQITWPIGHSNKSSKKMIAIQSGSGASKIRGRAQSAHTVLLSVESVVEHSSDSLSVYDLKVQIYTGVMHQIRVHLAAMGLPILGDTRYGQKCPIKASRLHLHASSLTLPTPTGASNTMISLAPWA